MQVTRAGGLRGPACPVPPLGPHASTLVYIFAVGSALSPGATTRPWVPRLWVSRGEEASAPHTCASKTWRVSADDRLDWEGAWLRRIGQSGLWCWLSSRNITAR